jgi:hypothetical protein
VVGEGLVVIIDLEKDDLAVSFECAEVVFAVWVVGVTEAIIDSDCFHDVVDGFSAKGGDARGDDGVGADQMLPQVVLELSSPSKIGLHPASQGEGEPWAMVTASGWQFPQPAAQL